MADREWSAYQQALFDFGTSSKGHGLVNAVAGSGKTTAIEELCRRLPANTRIKYLVFNKRNADEAQAKMPHNVEASTFHSACMRSLMGRLRGRVKVDGDKLRWLFKDMDDKEGLLQHGEFYRYVAPVTKLVGLGKNSGLDAITPATPDAWQELVDHFGIEVNAPKGENYDAIEDRLIELAQMLLDRSNNQLWRIDFDDMLYLTVRLDVDLPSYDVVCVDEAQDTNGIQRNILHRMLNHHGRLIAVGDPRQAIYGFRGASADAMQIISDEFNAIELPLSINYRCSTSVLDAARQYCPQLEARPDAPVGSVESMDVLDLDVVQPSDAILCRYTAPLIQNAMRLIAARKPCTVLGRDVGKGLIDLVKQLRKDGAANIEAFSEALIDYHNKEAQRISMRHRNVEVKMQQLDDRCDSLMAFVESADPSASTDTLVSEIEALFSDNAKAGAITLATVHKAKGLEWDRVWLVDRSRMPSKYATQDWMLEQENNLIYVAYTRAKVDLVLVG